MYTKKEDKHLIYKLISLLKPFIKEIIITISCMIVVSLISILIPRVNQLLVDEGLISKNLDSIIKYSILSLILIIIIQILEFIETKYCSYIQCLFSYNIEKIAFEHTLDLKMNFFKNINYAELISDLRININNISKVADRNTFFIITSLFRMTAGIIGLSLINWKLGLLVIVITPLRYIIVKFLAFQKKRLFVLYLEYYKDYSGWYGDTIGGIKEVKIWGLELTKIKEFIEKQKNIIHQNIKMMYLEKFNDMSETILVEIITLLLNIIGGYMVINQRFSIGTLFAFMSYSHYVTSPISAILNISYNFANILPSAKRYFDFIDLDTETNKERKNVQLLDYSKISGDITFENVEFSYADKEIILKGISFIIKSGEKVAIIGYNGSGKTTIINLLLRFLEPKSGKILLDGKDINSFDLKLYRKLISVVSQDTYLFNTSIKENILLNSNKSDEILYSVAQKSGAYEFIKEIPNQYESIVGERGSKLSGGERQKVAMARAFVREPKILILDEATSNYDMESERQVNNIIKTNFDNTTTIIVTHRLDILKKVDKIIVLKNGIIDDIGTHLELNIRNEFYKEMISKSSTKNSI